MRTLAAVAVGSVLFLAGCTGEEPPPAAERTINTDLSNSSPSTQADPACPTENERQAAVDTWEGVVATRGSAGHADVVGRLQTQLSGLVDATDASQCPSAVAMAEAAFQVSLLALPVVSTGAADDALYEDTAKSLETWLGAAGRSATLPRTAAASAPAPQPTASALAPETVPSPSPQQESALMEQLGAIAPEFNHIRSTYRARNVCGDIVRGEPEDVILQRLKSRYTGGTHPVVTDEEAVAILQVIRETFCS